MIQASDRVGRLVFVMGPSGAGKDTLMSYARERVDPARIVFSHRYITRAADSGGENHVALSEREFSSRLAAGLFALNWESHGLSYAIGNEIDLWRSRGLVVVVSGSRAVWPQAKARYPGLMGILVDAPIELRARRIAMRGRENESSIRERLGREVVMRAGDGVRHINNGGAVESAGEMMISVIDEASFCF